MTKIEELEILVSEWEATVAELENKTGKQQELRDAYNRCDAFRVALAIFKRPPNTQMHAGTKPCAECEKERKNYPWPPFCKWCGRALSQ